MKKYLILLLASAILFSGCVDQRTVKTGDNVTIDYVGSLQDGTVFDTSIKAVAEENNITKSDYKPLPVIVGKGKVIKGLDEGLVGMKVGDSKTLTITPDRAYGPVDPQMIQTIPIVQVEPATLQIPKVLEIPIDQFEGNFGTGYKIGDSINYPGTNINMTLKDNTTNATLVYNLSVGYKIISEGAPWNQTVTKIDDKNITIRHDAKKNSTVNFFPGAPWNTTVVDVTNDNITLRHNAVPDTEIPTMFGRIKVHFNETDIIMDRNHEYAGKTLIFNVTLRSIDK
ncbi:MAG: FKBP-type peptidyl-prolyl cis-trans isomerase [Candidatus Methanoperedens sp.]|nr:FKBP-type peptidyl-prolyl cis-trans isomerase [Candidatus Methanoperedens sp.]